MRELYVCSDMERLQRYLLSEKEQNAEQCV